MNNNPNKTDEKNNKEVEYSAKMTDVEKKKSTNNVHFDKIDIEQDRIGANLRINTINPFHDEDESFFNDIKMKRENHK